MNILTRKLCFNPQMQSYIDEESQLIDIRFALARINKGIILQQTPFVKCRDFLSDAIVANYKHEVSDEVFGFYFNGKRNRIDAYHTVLLIATKDKKLIERALNYVRKYEGVKKTVAYCVEQAVIIKSDKYDIYLVIGPSQWSKTSVAMSLYTLLIRTAGYGHETIEEFLKGQWQGTREYKALQELFKIDPDVIEKFLLNQTEIINPIDGSSDGSPFNYFLFHGSSGIQTLAILTNVVRTRGPLPKNSGVCSCWANNFYKVLGAI